jgi:type II secretory pathway component GspD/PulD (secretin)
MNKSIMLALISCPVFWMAAAPAALAEAPPKVEQPAAKMVTSCKKLPPGKRILKLDLKPDSEVSDLIGWISMVTCKQFVVPDDVAIKGKKVTIMSPQLMTIEEAYQLFTNTLASVNLKVQPEGTFLRIVEVKPRPGAAPAAQ